MPPQVAHVPLFLANRSVPSSSALAGFPDASNTGYTGSLTPYGGSTNFTSGTTSLSSQQFGAADADVSVNVSGDGTLVTLTNCSGFGHISIDPDSTAKLVLIDCTWNGLTFNGPVIEGPCDLLRCNISGGKDSLSLTGGQTIRDSWLHDIALDPASTAHTQIIRCSGNGSVAITIDHCTIGPNNTAGNGAGGGPTSTVFFVGDFTAVANITLKNSWVRNSPNAPFSGSWGLDESKPFPHPSGIQVLNNAFDIPGGFTGTNTSWYNTDPTNVWSGNYDKATGATVNFGD